MEQTSIVVLSKVAEREKKMKLLWVSLIFGTGFEERNLGKHNVYNCIFDYSDFHGPCLQYCY